jgi:hypothetical protein
LLPGQKAALEAARRDGLAPEQRAALDVPPAERSEAQQRLAAEAGAALVVDWAAVAREAPADLRPRAKQLAAQLKEAEETATIIARYREIVNFGFWRAICEAEVTEPAPRRPASRRPSAIGGSCSTARSGCARMPCSPTNWRRS